jgi:hypothetical protein
VLAAFSASRTDGRSLADFLNTEVFVDIELDTVDPDPADVAGFEAFIQRYVAALPVERAAVEYSRVGGMAVERERPEPELPQKARG